VSQSHTVDIFLIITSQNSHPSLSGERNPPRKLSSFEKCIRIPNVTNDSNIGWK
jgi:hypothetical protein